MPTVLKIGPYRFFFYSSDGNEPVHIHVERENMTAKFWLDPIRFQESTGFKRSEILKIQKLVQDHVHILVEAWNEYFNG